MPTILLEAAARVAHSVDAETRAYEIRMRAARKTGELSKKIEKVSAKGNQHTGKVVTPDDAEVNLTSSPTQQASDWERLSEVPEDQFEAALSSKSVRDLIDKPSPVDGDALLLYGMMHDFERR